MSDQTLLLMSLAEQLEDFIQTTVPSAEKVSKYGGVLFTLKPEQKEGQFCGVFIYKEHVQISFSLGAELDDPTGMLEGTGKRRRHVNFKDATDVNYDALEGLINQASLR
ncbi:DUF1801 domain-containing protein [Litoribrevibacter albus]|uniref:YdhG-like domain-containing protein n=1 Tax=Litoribrevibacter albus TaxID=1473156 RepID=A0AA37W8D4_9GAMM|nr:DUF1801 domain-containing protein [Litoribrevibacter albus]GLQ31346.1 hypothetical protein GCM10007876_18250 [Litoribrevibacter albus]